MCVWFVAAIIVFIGGVAGGQQIMNLVLDMMSVKSPGNPQMKMTYNLRLRGEVWAGAINLALSEYIKCAILEGIHERGKSPGIL